jgi:hypothetical protein
MQQGNRLSWSDLQSLARRKPAANSSDRDAAEAAADGGNGRGLAKALSVPHLTAIGTFIFSSYHRISFLHQLLDS